MRDSSRRRREAVGLVLALACLVSGVATLPAGAVSGAADPPRLVYRCTVSVTDLGSTIRVVYRLASNGPHERWTIRMWSRGRRFLASTVRTDENGHLRVAGETLDYAGRDEIRASGRRIAGGPACRVVLKA